MAVITKEAETRLISLICWGGLASTMIVTDKLNNEPYNLGKLVVITTLASICLSFLLASFKSVFIQNKLLVLALSTFVLAHILSMVLSESPIERSLYGAFGRNSGLLTYLSLSLIALSIVLIRSSKGIEKILLFLAICSILNALIALLDIFDFSFFAVTDTFGLSVGTLGNPNFLGSFLGLSFPIFLTYMIYFRKNYLKIGAFLLLIILVLNGVRMSGALQGYLLILIGTYVVLWFTIRAFVSSKFVLLSYSLLGFLAGFTGLLGVLRLGPLASILYKPSVTFRGEYWQTGLNMGFGNFLFGVGPDSFGLYFREYRDESATIFPGIDVTTDTAHNVMIDIFSGVGIFGIVSYLSIIAIVFVALFKAVRLNKRFDPILISLTTAWFCYQIQSIISINQIGLATWGWILSGAIVAYYNIFLKNQSEEKLLKQDTRLQSGKKSGGSQLVSAKTLISIVVSTSIGLIISIPPLIVDTKVRNVLSSKSTAIEVEALAYLWPQDNARFEKVTVALAGAGFSDEAKKVSLSAVEKYPMDYRNWYSLLQLTPSDGPERSSYLAKLHELDPFNPDYFDK